ncbi:hypothetical protein MVEN_02219100 [Mycena venus]|uniref:Uncharacterized protein n=1 Tax=Mycena venus TaxID=2733690 RepID=A0A8H6X6Z4_9AGAR|nr:hypothetical protein MVEN_02219100 [Mycena venus]
MSEYTGYNKFTSIDRRVPPTSVSFPNLTSTSTFAIRIPTMDPRRTPRPPLQARRLRVIAISFPILVVTGYTLIDRMINNKGPLLLPSKYPVDPAGQRSKSEGATELDKERW